MAITTVDIPHNLGRAVARQRLRDNVGDLGRHIPGGVAALETRWPVEDQLVIDLTAMGQGVTATIDVEDSLVRVSFALPGMLSFLGGAIASAVRSKGSQLLLPPGKS
ncbi:polyhydroxyalkanoic acid system family protein [Sandarakinorhabdus sp. DWP1-3-1]|uniref:polyhydroxyalkanoic acid system family protein n=1 Tax=Sandarakinorhabdus sp. DWP1-3-1 TaxID=2804627 RepID=UPI003CEDB044